MSDGQYVYVEGNNGGDYFELQELECGCLHLKVGHCCVVVLEAIVPVEWLTYLISSSTIDKGVKHLADESGWPKHLTEKIAHLVTPAEPEEFFLNLDNRHDKQHQEIANGD